MLLQFWNSTNEKETCKFSLFSGVCGVSRSLFCQHTHGLLFHVQLSPFYLYAPFWCVAEKVRVSNADAVLSPPSNDSPGSLPLRAFMCNQSVFHYRTWWPTSAHTCRAGDIHLSASLSLFVSQHICLSVMSHLCTCAGSQPGLVHDWHKVGAKAVVPVDHHKQKSLYQCHKTATSHPHNFQRCSVTYKAKKVLE